MDDIEPSLKPHLPEEETACLREHYESARSILEYGSGGSTWLAASLSGKYIVSVESDFCWAIDVQHKIDRAGLPSSAFVWHADIGPTGRWGRPLDDRAWPRFYLYSLGIWDQPFLRHPDVVFIDGRFRPACLAATCLRITQPVTVLFDDYRDRPQYHVVERFAGSPKMTGRMAVFDVVPNCIPNTEWTMIVGLFGQTKLALSGADAAPGRSVTKVGLVVPACATKLVHQRS